MAFDPKNLVPASDVAELNKAQAGRTMKAVALSNIDKQIELLADAKKEGKRSFRVAGDKAAFTVRVANQALVLETLNVRGTKVEVKEMSCPAADLKAALLHYRGKIERGDYDAALAGMDGARAKRVEKMRKTRNDKRNAAK